MVTYIEFATSHLKDKQFEHLHQHDKMREVAKLWKSYKLQHGISAPKKKVNGGKISGLRNKPRRNRKHGTSGGDYVGGKMNSQYVDDFIEGYKQPFELAADMLPEGGNLVEDVTGWIKSLFEKKPKHVNIYNGEEGLNRMRRETAHTPHWDLLKSAFNKHYGINPRMG